MSISGIGANVLGYSDKDVNNAVNRVIDNGSSSSLNPEEEVILADLMVIFILGQIWLDSPDLEAKLFPLL